jgi:Nucleotidyltransferase domain
MASESSSVEILRASLGSKWPAINKSVQTSIQKKRELLDLFSQGQTPDSEDRSVVAFGSVGRDEWTSGSDLDWTLLVDGTADPAHLMIAQEIESKLQLAKFREPSRNGVFGSMAFSHDIIHKIGGENDTNRNTTQRILLLLESTVVAERPDAYNRVIRGVFNRYLEEDTSFPDQGGKQYRVPRFLLNDIVRFWRTMAVDFASKQRERGGKGWGLRNAKLRMSRKLIFVSGLLMCFSCSLSFPHEDTQRIPDTAVHPLVDHLVSFAKQTPLEILAEALLSYEEMSETALKIFNAYDQFLAMLDEKDSREELDALTAQNAAASDTFQKMRAISHEFQDGLTRLFFENAKLAPLTRKYGVF